MANRATEVLLKSMGNRERFFGYVKNPISAMGEADKKGYGVDIRTNGAIVIEGKNGDDAKLRKLLKPYFNTYF
jgi:hypothetical protein